MRLHHRDWTLSTKGIRNINWDWEGRNFNRKIDGLSGFLRSDIKGKIECQPLKKIPNYYLKGEKHNRWGSICVAAQLPGLSHAQNWLQARTQISWHALHAQARLPPPATSNPEETPSSGSQRQGEPDTHHPLTSPLPRWPSAPSISYLLHTTRNHEMALFLPILYMRKLRLKGGGLTNFVESPRKKVPLTLKGTTKWMLFSFCVIPKCMFAIHLQHWRMGLLGSSPWTALFLCRENIKPNCALLPRT